MVGMGTMAVEGYLPPRGQSHSESSGIVIYTYYQEYIQRRAQKNKYFVRYIKYCKFTFFYYSGKL